MMTINNSLLNEKYNNVIKSIRDMMSPIKSERPTCEQLLNNKSQWALSMSHIQNDFKKFKTETKSLENCLIKRFIRIKSKNEWNQLNVNTFFR
jgi:hypothetical protein